MRKNWIRCRLAADGSCVDLDMALIVGFAASDNFTRVILLGADNAQEAVDVRESPEELAVLMNDADTLAVGACIYGQTAGPRTEH